MNIKKILIGLFVFGFLFTFSAKVTQAFLLEDVINQINILKVDFTQKDSLENIDLSVSQRTLREGMSGNDIATLQSYLSIRVDGKYGPQTLNQVKNWQIQNGLTPDGVFGPKSFAKIYQELMNLKGGSVLGLVNYNCPVLAPPSPDYCVNGIIGVSQGGECPSYECIPNISPSITVISPNGGEAFTDGQQIKILWDTQNFSINSQAGAALKIYDMYNNYLGNIGLTTNTVPTTIAHATVTLPKLSYIQTLYKNTSGHFKVIVSSYDTVNGVIDDTSDNYFAINSLEINPSIFPAGCSSNSSFSSTTGIACSTGKNLISYWYGKVNKYTDPNTGLWQTDPDGVSGANIDMLTYCKKWYPNTTRVEEFKEQTLVDWKDRGNVGNYTSVKMAYSCLKDNIVELPSITVISPNGGEAYTAGKQITVKWKSENMPQGAVTRLFLVRNLPSGHQDTRLLLDTSNNYDIRTGYYIWQIPNDITPASNYFVNVTCGVANSSSPNCLSANGSSITNDSGYFTITNSTTTPSITVLSPNGGEVWNNGGVNHVVKYKSNGVGSVFIKLVAPSSTLNNLVGFYNPNINAFGLGNMGTGKSNLTSYTWDGTVCNSIIGDGLDEIRTGCYHVPPGTYKIHVEATIDGTSGPGYSVSDLSDNYFKINSTTQTAPVISGVSGPQTLNVNQQGTWTVKASDPSGGNLSYSVWWGDEVAQLYATSNLTTKEISQQSATFTHTYSRIGTYLPEFIVKNSSGLKEKTSLSVNVFDSTNVCPITIDPVEGYCLGGKVEPVYNFITNCIESFKCLNPQVNDGCRPGFNFSSTTGLPCINTVTNNGCRPGFNFSPINGQACLLSTQPIIQPIGQPQRDCTTPGSNCGVRNYGISRNLKLWEKGEDVKILQALLNLIEDGVFGPVTRQKVIEWQAQNGLMADGIFGAQSRQVAGFEN